MPNGHALCEFIFWSFAHRKQKQMYLLVLLITFIFIWKRIYGNGYCITPKNAHCIRSKEAKLILAKRGDAMQVIIPMLTFKLFQTNVVSTTKKLSPKIEYEKKNSAKSSSYNLESF